MKKQDKPRMDLIPARALLEVGKVLSHGVGKYPEDPTSIGRDLNKEFAALQRHAWRWKSGQKIDHDSGLNAMAHVAARALIALEQEIKNAVHSTGKKKRV
jgi:hypothetical protein